MSVSLWRWTEECDQRPCPGDCDECEIEQNYNLEDDDSPCQNCGE